MEIISEPFTEETVTDYDFTFTGDEKLGITLKSQDYASLDPQTGWLNVRMTSPDGRIAVNLPRVLWMSEHKRVVKTPINTTPVPSDPPNPS